MVAWYNVNCKKEDDVGDAGFLAVNITQDSGRPASDNKCSVLTDDIEAFEIIFVQVLYGSWCIWHFLFVFYPRISFNIVMLDFVPSIRTFMAHLCLKVGSITS